MKKRISNPIIANANGKMIATGTTGNSKKKFPDLGVYKWQNPANSVNSSKSFLHLVAKSILKTYGTEIGSELANLPIDIANYLMAYDLNDDKNFTVLAECKKYFGAEPYSYISKQIIKAANKKDDSKSIPLAINRQDVINIMGQAIASPGYMDTIDEVANTVYKYQTDNYIPPLIQQSTRDDAESQGSTSGNGGDKKDNDAGEGEPNSDKKSDNSTLLIVIGVAILVGIMMLKKSR